MVVIGGTTAGCRDAGSAQADTGTADSGTTDDTGSADVVGDECAPGQRRECYEGPVGTATLGACRVGSQTCSADGTAWSACMGQVQPEPAERCDTPQDDDCDGTAECEPVLSWSEPFPATAFHVAVDPQGYVVVAGGGAFDDFQDQTLGGLFVMQLRPDGQLRWVRSFSSGGAVSVGGMAVDEQGGITMVGSHQGSPDFGGGPLEPVGSSGAYLVRFDREGVHRFSRTEDHASFAALALGSEGSTYALGRDEALTDEGSFQESLVIAAFDAEGQPRWSKTGHGVAGLYEDAMTIAATAQGEVVVSVVMGEGGLVDAELDGVPLELPGYVPTMLRLDAEGTLLQQRLPYDEPTGGIADLELSVRPDGILELVANHYGGGTIDGIVLTRFDDALEPLLQLQLGDGTWVQAQAPGLDGTSVLGIEFFGQLELGPIGVGVPSFGPGLAIAAVDGAGDGRWLELLYSMSFAELHALAVGPSGEVVVAARVDGGGTLAGGAVGDRFLAMLRP